MMAADMILLSIHQALAFLECVSEPECLEARCIFNLSQDAERRSRQGYLYLKWRREHHLSDAHDSPPLIRVLLADDHELLRQGLKLLLQLHPEMQVVGEARTGREAVEMALSLRPDVVVMDISMPDMDGLE